MIFGTGQYVTLLHDVVKTGKRHDLYEKTCAHAKEMAVHVFGDKPLHLIEKTRPREDEEVKKYRLDNYEPTTKAGCDKALDIVSKIFNPQLYSIRWKNDEGEQIKQLREYLFEYYPEYNSLMSYNKDVVLRNMIADPNGVLAVKPRKIPEVDAEMVEPVAVVYASENVWYRDDDHVLIFVRKERIQQEHIDRYYFEYYDKNVWLEFYVWIDATQDRTHVVELQRYEHNFKEAPFWSLRGKSKGLGNGQVIFESFFSSALPHWNLAVRHESDLLGAYINHLHPQKYELAEECAYRHPYQGSDYPCSGGVIRYPGGKDGDIIDLKCPACQGTGLTTVKSPFGVYQFTKSKLDLMTEGGRGAMMPVGYVTIPVEATKMLEERTSEMIRKGMWAINMDIEDKVGENQSGVAKVIDRSAQHDTLQNISTVFYDFHLQNEIYFINKYMFSIEAKSRRDREDGNLPEVNKPTNFDILSVSELVNNFKVAKESGLDRNFLQTRQIEILSRDLSTNPDLKRYLVAMMNLDPLPGLSLDEIQIIVNKEATMEDAVIHFNLKKFMDRAIMEDEGFLEKPKDEQYEKFQEFAQEIIDANKPALTELVFEPEPDAPGGFAQPDRRTGNQG